MYFSRRDAIIGVRFPKLRRGADAAPARIDTVVPDGQRIAAPTLKNADARPMIVGADGWFRCIIK